MADLILHRKFKGKEYTIGKLYRLHGDNEIYICDILEDVVRNPITTAINKFVKIYGETAIPYGKYEIVRTYSNRFKKVMPLLLNVPHYEGVRIHTGNYAGYLEYYTTVDIPSGVDIITDKEYFKVV